MGAPHVGEGRKQIMRKTKNTLKSFYMHIQCYYIIVTEKKMDLGLDLYN